MVKTYNVKYNRILKSTGKKITESMQADANNCEGAKRKVRLFFKKTSTNNPIRINKCSIAKTKKPDYLRI